jgi:pyrroloquinoline quinone biosynthesis protein B
MMFDAPVSVARPDGAQLGLHVTAFAVPGKAPLYLEKEGPRDGDTIGLAVADETGRCFFYLPGCAALPAALTARLRNAALVFFDGTLWRDDEMVASCVGTKTGTRMGHMSMAGEHGSIAALASLGIARKIFIHINNTNPVLLADSPERAEAARAGWEIADDGMEIRL